MKKKILILILLILFPIIFSGCEKSLDLTNYLTELRSNIFCGECEDFSLRASYGFKESPMASDGNVGAKKYSLTFKLQNAKTDTNYTLFMSYGGKDYSIDFTINPVTNSLTAVLDIDSFTEKQFAVRVLYAGKSKDITLNSIVPKDTMEYSKALNGLQKSQPSLISAHLNQNGEFNAEIYMRVIVKDNRSFYYVGIASGNDNLKAFLLDGKSGEVLAIREVL